MKNPSIDVVAPTQPNLATTSGIGVGAAERKSTTRAVEWPDAATKLSTQRLSGSP